MAPAPGWFRFGSTRSGSAELVAWNVALRCKVALSGTVQGGDVVENVLGVPHSGHGQYHDPDRYQRDHYPQLPRHRFTAPYTPRFPV